MNPAEKKSVLNAGKFVLALLGIAALLGFFVALVSMQSFKEITAFTSSAVLRGIGVPNSVEPGEDVYIILANPEKTTIVISDLCTGALETAILVAAIVATLEIHWKKRAIGAIAAVLGIFFFNQLRIVSTVFFILNAPVEMVELSHDVFFRVFLFITIAVFYWLFLKWENRQTIPTESRQTASR